MRKSFTIIFLLAALTICKSNCLIGQVNVQDSLALVALYDNTDGPKWWNHTNWLTIQPVSTWFGITVFNNRVIGITLSNNSLYGHLPGKLGNLSNLLVLNLESNRLNNELPSELGNLTNLVTLNLSFNKLLGKIPYSFGNLVNLDTLILTANRFNTSNAIPVSIGNLTNLKYLALANNNLGGKIPSAIGNLVNLENLDLGANRLSGEIPSSIGRLTMLTFLSLGVNKLTGEIPSSIGNLTLLTTLYLNNNQLTGEIPFSIGKLINLKLLLLVNNKLSGTIPSSLAQLQRHTQVSLYNNAFTFSGIGKLIRARINVQYSPQANIFVNQNGNILSVYAGGALNEDTYKWFKNGIPVATITGDSTYQPNVSGNYYVAVTNSVATALTLYSNVIDYNLPDNLIASQINNKNLSVSVYPNPAKTNARLSFNADGKYTITVADVSGKILQTKIGIAVKGTSIIQLDVSKYASGMYLITITDEKNNKQTLRLNKG